MTGRATPEATAWQKWVQHPERVRVRQVIFQLHIWLGAFAAVYVLVMSASGSVIVFRNELSPFISIEWLVRLHHDLLSRRAGGLLNAIGAWTLILLCVTGAVVWWPGVAYWRRSLTIEWRAHIPRISWDAHSAFGFWFFPFVLVWGLSGAYLAAPQLFDVLQPLDPDDHVLFALAQLHFGRFNLVTEVIWAVSGLVPSVLALTGIVIYCRRCLLRLPSNPKHTADWPLSNSGLEQVRSRAKH